jgi:hypothetical protein
MYTIKNKFNDKNYSIYLDISRSITESSLNDLILGYIYLDYNLKFVKNYLIVIERFQDKKNKIHRSSSKFSLLPDLREFLSIRGFINAKDFPELIEDDYLLTHPSLSDKTSDNKGNKQKSLKINKKEKKNDEEDYGFVIIDNYYV